MIFDNYKLLQTMINLGVRIKYLFDGSWVRTIKGCNCQISSDTKIKNSKIYVYQGATLTIGSGCVIENADICVEKGNVSIADNVIIRGDGQSRVNIIVNDGNLTLADYTKLSLHRIWIRFGGSVSIGEYTNINSGSEIRCDMHVEVGAFTRVSYNVKIWDTNTHSILPVEARRDVLKRKWPYYGYEQERPSSVPVKIGDDCWIGENAAILKGSNIGNASIVGFGTIIAGKTIPEYTKVVNGCNLKLSEIKH